MSRTFDQFGHSYQSTLDNCMSMGVVEKNKRTGTMIRMNPMGASFFVYMGAGTIPTCGLRKTKPWHAAAEAAWCFRGDQNIKWLQKHTHVWDQFAEKDGTLDQAYGHRWRTAFGFDQLLEALERLEKDPTDRRIWVSSYMPQEDLIDAGQKTVPCPVGFTLSIMDSQLCSTLMIRSSDLYFGLPYDVMRHGFIMAAIAQTLGVGLGNMRVTLAHPHIYAPQWSIVAQMLRMLPRCPYILLPKANVEDIVKDPDYYVNNIKEHCARVSQDEWPEDYKSEVVA